MVDVAGLALRGVPILCCDTCSILDIMRDPTRSTVRAHEGQAALNFLHAMESGNALVGLVAEQVCIEFGANAGRVEEEAIDALRKLTIQLSRMDAVAKVFGGIGRADVGHFDGHVARARDVANRWMSAATVVDQESYVANQAIVRLNHARAPARQGKDSAKDCVVIETYLDIVAKLRSAGSTSKIVFVSSNTRDYAAEAGATARNGLAAEFLTVNMEYAPNLAAAKFLLGL